MKSVGSGQARIGADRLLCLESAILPIDGKRHLVITL